MNGWLIDTNVISELQRKIPNPKVVNFVSSLPLAEMHISIVTIVEIRFGIAKSTDPAQRTRLANWLYQLVHQTFAGRVLGLSEDILLTWRLLLDTGRKQGLTFSQPDLFLAATASVFDLTVVTRDVSDFTATGCRIHNPWT